MRNEPDGSIRAMIEAAYEAFNRRDLPGVLTIMARDVEWSNGWEGGFVSGHDGVRDYWTRLWQAIDPLVEPVSFEAREDGRVVVTANQVIRQSDGTPVRAGLVRHVYTLRGELIARMDIEEIVTS